MKTKSVLTILIYALLLSACVGVTPYPTPPTIPATSTISPTITKTTTPTPTSTLILTPTPRWYTPTPETLDGYPTPEIMILPTCGIDGCWLNFTPEPQRQELTFYELYVGKYVVRNWCDTDPKVNHFIASCAVIISSSGMEQEEVWGYGKAWVGAETGADLTGNGIPEIVIDTWSGAIHDGRGKIVYEARDTPTIILEVHGDGTFIDLNKDGTYEYVTPYKIWSNSLNNSVTFYLAYEYQGDAGYVLQASKFIDETEQYIQQNFDILAEFATKYPGSMLQLDSLDASLASVQGSLYKIVAYYLIKGEEDAALELLNKYFSEEKATEHLLVIKSDMGSLIEP